MNEMIESKNNEPMDEGYTQLTTADAGWTEEERESMRERGFDEMDMLRTWLS